MGALALTNAKEPVNRYSAMRQRALEVSPDVMKLPHLPGVPFGILMEIGYEQAVVTLLTLSDGTTSLYFSNGGGVIGCGQHATVAEAARTLMNTSQALTGNFLPTYGYPLPEIGEVSFYALTDSGVLSHRANELVLQQKKDALSPLYYKGQEVITAIRVLGLV